MLVLTRKPREEIRIGNGITITILRVKGQSVRVGIDAPNDVRIVRGELNPETESADGPQEEPDGASQKAVDSIDSNATPSAAAPHRCEQTPPVLNSERHNGPCPARISKPHRRNSSLQSLVARHRTTTARTTDSSAASGSGPPR